VEASQAITLSNVGIGIFTELKVNAPGGVEIEGELAS
jgi:hypothetical protein